MGDSYAMQFYRVLAVLLIAMASALVITHLGHTGTLNLPAAVRLMAGVGAGFIIGIVAALMGVAGGELLIPTIVLLFAVDIKIAGSLSLAVSVPTMLVAFARYSLDQSFNVLRSNMAFLLVMASGSIAGTLIGGLLVGMVSSFVLIPMLACLLVLSALRVWRHVN